MPDYSWPPPENRTLIGKRISRVDSPVKVSGRAKYTYDQNPKGLLAGAIGLNTLGARLRWLRWRQLWRRASAIRFRH